MAKNQNSLKDISYEERRKEFFSQIDIPLKVTKDNISTGMQIFGYVCIMV